MARPMSKNLYDWCVENNQKDWLELWDYELNDCSPKDVGYGSGKKYYFKCPRGVHKSELKKLNGMTNKEKYILSCDQCNSFGQWIIDKFGENALELYWDYEKNKVNPFEISRSSSKKVWLFCQEKSYHGSYEVVCGDFIGGNRCPYCSHHGKKIHPKDSFGQLLMNEHGTLDGIWDFEKNGDLDPFKIYPQSNKKVTWLFCQEKDYHGSYKIRCGDFTTGSRCPYCCNHHGKVHSRDSFAQYHIDNTDKDFIKKYWSDKNTVDPFSLAPCSSIKVWFICQNDEEHEDYESTCANFTHGRRCPECNESYGEREIRRYLDAYNIDFIPQKEFSDLLGVGNGNLSYDFYIPEQNLLIEYQGEFHDGTAYQQTEEDYLKQQEHDRRKREYAELHNIKLLEIWYWNFDNIEEILNKELGLS